MTRIAMWCAPRTISTALMRAWGNRPDTVVIDEPFYAHYLQATGWQGGWHQLHNAGVTDTGKFTRICLHTCCV